MTEEMTEEEARRQRSIEILKREGVPCAESLPLIESEADISKRPRRDVALRAIALAIVSLKAETGDQEVVTNLIERYGIASDLTPKEQAFIREPSPSQKDVVQLSWRCECLWVMLWALDFIEDMGRPDRQIDPAVARAQVFDLDRDTFLARAKLRPAAALLDAADLIYRYHWAVRDAQLFGREIPGNLNEDVVIERHHALNWLIGYEEREWDDISTDT